MTTKLSTKRAVGYFRVSTTGQTRDNHSSLETQEAHYQEYCDRLDLLPVRTFTDVQSGRRDDRREYREMVDYVITQGVDVIVVQYLDRFGRNPQEMLTRYWELQAHDVEVVATDEDIKDELILLVKAGMAGAEIKRTSERVRSNMGRAVQKGVHAARAAYGFRRVYEGRSEVKWEIDPVEGPVVREMYRLAVEENLGYKLIADRLSAAGYVARQGRNFASYTVQRILSNEGLMGTLSYGKKPRKGNPSQDIIRVPDFFPPILTADEWAKLQERLEIRRSSSRGRTHSSPYLLSGMAKCGNCGGAMVGKVGSAWKGKRYRNYYCSRAMRSKAQCSTYNGHSTQKLEEAVLEYLGRFSDPKLVKEHIESASRKELEQKQKEMRSAEKALQALDAQFMKRIELVTHGTISEEEFVRANEPLRSEKAAVEAHRDELQEWLVGESVKASTAEEMPRNIDMFIKDFGKLDVRHQKARLQTILKAVHVHNGDKIELEFRD